MKIMNRRTESNKKYRIILNVYTSLLKKFFDIITMMAGKHEIVIEYIISNY